MCIFIIKHIIILYITLRGETAPFRSQTRFAPSPHSARAQAPAPLTPARPASPRFPPRSPVCSGSAAQPERPGSPRHPPPGCPRAAAAARRAPVDQYAATPDATPPDR